ncbi:377_t:CDS:2 [Diversispora eburnea]|uniref:377_t:CDS:1 n=1 Tax=Diversispora eburnea TaxID=1213867 RepID=A0A9N8YN17_9GLOM|nr:377_t:CDS:2 [Diversispora eburnea]
MYLKLDLFFVLVTAIEVFLSFSVDTSGSSFTFKLPNKLYYFHLGITIMILILEILAYRSLTWVWTLFVLMNFDQGLDKYLNKTKDNENIDLEGVTQTRPKRFTIED